MIPTTVSTREIKQIHRISDLRERILSAGMLAMQIPDEITDWVPLVREEGLIDRLGQDITSLRDYGVDISTKITSAELPEADPTALPLLRSLYESPLMHSARIAGHDLCNILTIFQGNARILRMDQNPGTVTGDVLQDIIQESVANLQQLKAYTAAMAYHATGDEQFIYPIPVENLPHILGDGRYEVTNVDYVSNIALMIIHQAKKNAEKNCKANRISPKVCIGIYGEQDYYTVTLSDNGTGFQINAPEELSGFFMGKTTGGTGLGLQIVRELCRMQDSYYFLVTSTDGNNGFLLYDSPYGITSLETIAPQRGSELAAHMPILKQKA